MSWPHYLRCVLGAAGLLALALYAFILVLDPYQNVPFSPPLARAPVSTNQRYAYPALARDPAFDSAIIGTSTVRLLDPVSLHARTGARFVNLAMNSATAYEQERMHALFVRRHPQLRWLVLGIDEVWCDPAATARRYTFRDFPEWMYDDDRWNDLPYLFNDKALENAVRMLELLLGQRPPKYRNDGYRDFTLDFPEWQRGAVERRLYRGVPRPVADAPIHATAAARPARTGAQRGLARMLAVTPPAARVILLWPPLHAAYLEPRATRLAECKGAIAQLASAHAGVTMLDYMYVSPLTRDSANYWDTHHYTAAVARMIETDIAALADGRRPPSAYARVERRVVPDAAIE